MRNIVKYVGLLLTIAGIAIIFLDHADGADIPLLVGLFILFISKESKEDERAVAIKASSAYTALIVSYGIKLVSTNLYSHNLVPFQLTEIDHFLILVFALAIIIFYARLYISSR